jgi:hypothetical protein
MSEQPVFSRKVLFAWITGVALAFACSLYFMGASEDSSDDAPAASVFSRSALGYAGIADILEKLGDTVVRSEGDAPARPAGRSVSIIAEPQFGIARSGALHALAAAETVLLILPKWRGQPNSAHRGWIKDADLVPEFDAIVTLSLGVDNAKLVRQTAVELWTKNALGVSPEIAEPVQLIQSGNLTPVVAGADGILVGELRTAKRRLWILSDPDVLSNHGIGVKDNAAFGVALLDRLRGPDGAVVFEDVEGLPGHAAKAALIPSSLLKLPFDAHFLPATLQAGVALALLLWAAVLRFGAPLPAPPPLDAGKRGLIQNAARLVAFAGYQRVMARRYVEATIREVGRRIHAPRGLADAGLVDWLGRIGKARGVEHDGVAIYAQAQRLDQGRRGDPAPLMAMLRDIHRWKREMIDGP